MNAKEQKIKEAWAGFYNPQVNMKNGWMDVRPGTYSNDQFFDRLKFNSEKHSIRPKSLQGIETNNNWIRIESESDLPKDKEICHFIPCNSFEDQFIGFIDQTMDEVFFVDKYYSSFYNDFNKPILKLNSYIPLQITHYQPIIKPQPPIY